MSAENPLDSMRDVIALSSLDWGESRDLAWVYGIVVGWDETGPDEEGEYEEDGPMSELAARFGWTALGVALLRDLHEQFERLTNGGKP